MTTRTRATRSAQTPLALASTPLASTPLASTPLASTPLASTPLASEPLTITVTNLFTKEEYTYLVNGEGKEMFDTWFESQQFPIQPARSNQIRALIEGYSPVSMEIFFFNKKHDIQGLYKSFNENPAVIQLKKELYPQIKQYIKEASELDKVSEKDTGIVIFPMGFWTRNIELNICKPNEKEKNFIRDRLSTYVKVEMNRRMGGRKTYKSKTYKRKTYKRKTYKRKSYKSKTYKRKSNKKL